jgi:hypothetical protein
MVRLIEAANKEFGTPAAAYTALGVSRRSWFYYQSGARMPDVLQRSIVAHLELYALQRSLGRRLP